MKRQITQEELDAAYASIRVAEEKRGEERKAAEPRKKSAASTPQASIDMIGLHIGLDRSNVVFASNRHVVAKHIALNSGHQDWDKFLAELNDCLAKEGKAKLPVYITLTGKPAHYTFTRAPRISRAMMMKAFKLQMKQTSKEDWEDLHFLPIPAAKKSADEATEYLVAGLNKSLLEKLSGTLKKLKLKPVAWDVDVLCYARALGHLWQQHRVESSTRFLVLLDWDHCDLIILGPKGQLISPRLPIGVQSFLDHLLQRREVSVPKSRDNKDWLQLTVEPLEVRERKVLANQAIHDVYVPMMQQIKTALYAACNEHGIELPTHLAVVAMGSSIFNLVDTLSIDLGLKPIHPEDTFPVEGIAAFGATFWERADLKMNFFPGGKREAARAAKEFFKNFRSKLSIKRPTLDLAPALPSGAPAVWALAIVGAIGIFGYPLWQRSVVSRLVETKKAELVSLVGEKERIKKAKTREDALDRRMAMVKMIDGKNVPLSRAIHELISVWPPAIKLQSLSFRDSILNLKGLSRDSEAVQKFLRSALEFRFLYEPTPLGIKRDKDALEFELTFKVRS